MPQQYEQGCHNLRLYLRHAKLPEMECTRFCPHLNNREVYNSTTNLFQLSPKPDSSRKLRLILHLLPAVINKKVTAFMLHIPNKPILGAHDTAYSRPATLCIPAPLFDISFYPPKGIYDIVSMSLWVDQPLLTAERVLSLVWPQNTEGYCIMVQQVAPVERSPDAELYRAYYYRKCRGIDQNDIQQPVCKMVIAALVPWAFTPKDIEDFVRVTQLPAFSMDHRDNEKNPPKYNRAHKIWAKLWDECTRKKCPYFILSVYDSWIFGVFVKGWTTALISETIQRVDEQPTVMQWLVFWFASSMKLPGAWETPLLSRFGNPDIRHLSKVALQTSCEDTEKEVIVAQEEWLNKNHKEAKESNDRRTKEMPGLENTWLTKFDGQ